MYLYNLEFTFNMKDINNPTQPKILNKKVSINSMFLLHVHPIKMTHRCTHKNYAKNVKCKQKKEKIFSPKK
jgi:hypothetical protein